MSGFLFRSDSKNNLRIHPHQLEPDNAGERKIENQNRTSRESGRFHFYITSINHPPFLKQKFIANNLFFLGKVQITSTFGKFTLQKNAFFNHQLHYLIPVDYWHEIYTCYIYYHVSITITGIRLQKLRQWKQYFL